MKQGWIQILGGLAILIIIPVLTILCLSPDVHDWIRSSLAGQFRPDDPSREDKSSGASQLMEQYRFPDSISKIAKISEEEPDLSKAASVPSSGFSRAMLRLQRALQAYPNWRTRDVFRAVNGRETTAQTAPCPFEQIDGEQSVVLGQDGHGKASLTETLNRCAAALEQTTDQRH